MHPINLHQLRGQKGCFIHLRALETVNEHGIAEIFIGNYWFEIFKCLSWSRQRTDKTASIIYRFLSAH